MLTLAALCFALTGEVTPFHPENPYAFAHPEYGASRILVSDTQKTQWDVWLPEGKYELCLATREIGLKGLPSKPRRVVFKGGTHKITLRQRESLLGWAVSVIVDGAEQFSVGEPKSWQTTPPIDHGPLVYAFVPPLDGPLVVLRRRFTVLNAAGMGEAALKLVNGVMLWLERK